MREQHGMEHAMLMHMDALLLLRGQQQQVFQFAARQRHHFPRMSHFTNQIATAKIVANTLAHIA
jgi:hypothetical protein